MQTISPRIKLLSEDHIQKIHQDSIHILAETGIRVDSIRAKKVFEKALGQDSESDIIKLPGDLIESAIQSTPQSIDIFNRLGERAFSIGGLQEKGTIYGVGVTNTWYQEVMTDELVPFSGNHVEIAARLAQTLEQYDLISTPGVIQDKDILHGEVMATLEMVSNTTKPLVLLVSDPKQFESSLEMLAHLKGDLSEKPFVIPYVNPITPLVLNEDTSEKIFTTLDLGLPFIYSSYGMSGATAPIGTNATLTMLNAELLAGLVFAQLIKPGTPVILGSLPSVFEMKTMISAYTSQTMLVNLACAEMMFYYRLPHAGTSGSGSGWGPDVLGSGTLWMNHLTSSMGKTGLAPFVGGNFDSQAFSPNLVVYSNEVIRQVRQLSYGFTMDKSALELDDIHAVGPGGNFLMSEQTLQHFLEVNEQHSQIWPGYSLEKWMEEDSPSATDHLRKHTGETLHNLQTPQDHDEIQVLGQKFIANLPGNPPLN